MIEIGSIGLIIALAAIYKAFSARIPFAEIPWFSILFYHRENFGGYKSIIINLLQLMLWVVVSSASMSLFAFAMMHLEEATSNLLTIANHDKYTTQSYITTLLITFGVYLFLIRRTENILKKYTSYMPLPAYSDTDKNGKEEQIPLGDIENKRFRNLLRKYFYSIPRLYAVVYHNFYNNVGIIVDGCACMLIEKCNPNTVCSFFDSHSKTIARADKRKGKIESIKDKISDPILTLEEKAYHILTEYIMNYGYRYTKNSIENFIRQRCSHTIDKNKRKNDRFLLKRPLKIKYLNNGSNSKGKIIETSSDGRGYYLHTKSQILVNNNINLNYKDDEFTGRIIHTSPCVYRGRIACGGGLYIIKKIKAIY